MTEIETGAVADFRWRAEQCRTNADGFDPKAAAVWDLAADALEQRDAAPDQPKPAASGGEDRGEAEMRQFQREQLRANGYSNAEVEAKLAQPSARAGDVVGAVIQDDRDAAAQMMRRISAGDYLGFDFGEYFRDHRLRHAAQPVEQAGWLPIESALKDGSLLELVVDYTLGGGPLQDATRACTIGFNSLADTGEDEWKFAGWSWTHDHFTEGSGSVIAWRPSRLNAFDDGLPPLPAPPAPEQRP